MSDETQGQSETKAKAKKEPVEVTMVRMEDGREVGFTPKKRMDKEVLLTDTTVAVRFDFRNGETRTFQVPGALLLQAAGHGVSQKVGDETAGDVKIEDMVIHVDEMLERLGNLEWSKVREAKDSFSGASIIVKAVAEYSGKTADEAKAWLKAKLEALKAKDPKITRNDLHNSFRKPGTKIAAIIKQLEDEELAGVTVADGEELLEEFAAS